jgi:hypothetical protein
MAQRRRWSIRGTLGAADGFFVNVAPTKLFAADRDFRWPTEAQLDAVAMHFQHSNLDISADYDRFTPFATENQHWVILLAPASLPPAS